MDVFDHFVLAGQSVTVGEAVVRRYRPVSAENDHIVLHIFSSDKDDCRVRTFLLHSVRRIYYEEVHFLFYVNKNQERFEIYAFILCCLLSGASSIQGVCNKNATYDILGWNNSMLLLTIYPKIK